MRWVPHAAIRPHHCAVIPFMGNASNRKGFFDTGVELAGWDPHIYVSVEAVEQMATMLGWQPPANVEAKDRKIADLEEYQKEREQAMAELREQLDAVGTLKAAGFTTTARKGKVAA